MSNRIVRDWKSQTDREREQRFQRKVKTTWILIGIGVGGLLVTGLLSNSFLIPSWLEGLLSFVFMVFGAVGLLRFSSVIREPIDAADLAMIKHQDEMEMHRFQKEKRNRAVKNDCEQAHSHFLWQIHRTDYQSSSQRTSPLAMS